MERVHLVIEKSEKELVLCSPTDYISCLRRLGQKTPHHLNCLGSLLSISLLAVLTYMDAFGQVQVHLRIVDDWIQPWDCEPGTRRCFQERGLNLIRPLSS